ncbi:MAG: hypothetical protein IJY34_01535 [Clostridia bacterium]|nr:hypothetical protein [Clostridia bacterium]
MKKLLALFLAGCITVFGSMALTACGDTGDGESTPDSGSAESTVTEEQWEAATVVANFENVTVHQISTNEQMDQDLVIKITANKLHALGTGVYHGANGDITQEIDMLLEGDEATQRRTMLLGVFLSIVDNYGDFAWSAEEKAYIATGEITAVSYPYGDDTVSHVAVLTNGKVTFDANGNMATYSGHIAESRVKDGQVTDALGSDLTWTFYDYNTTVIGGQEPEDTPAADTEVTADEFVAAFDLGDNWSFYLLSTHPTQGTYEATIQRAGNLFEEHFVQKDAEGSVASENYNYAEIVGDVLYEYTPSYSEDNVLQGYWKEPLEGTVEENVAKLLSGYIPAAFVDYSLYTYNAETKRYEAAAVSVMGREVLNVSFAFENGKLVAFNYTMPMNDGALVTYEETYAYGNASVTLPTNIMNGGTTPDEPSTDGSEVTEEEWGTSISDERFENVTFVQTTQGTTVYEGKPMEIRSTTLLKITVDGLLLEQEAVAGDEETQKISIYMTGEQKESQKSVFMALFRAILAKRESFVYDAEKGVYTLSETVHVSYTVGGGDFTAQVSQSEATFYEDGSLKEFKCMVVEDANGGATSYTHTEWTFFNYGTTEITQEEIDACNQGGSNNPNPENA